VALKTGEILRIVWRSLFLQVPLNYRTMQGSGYLFAIWPWLKKGDKRISRVRAASGYMNAHPVTATLAIGALLKRLQTDDAERDPMSFSLWKNMLCGPLGMTGDSLIWDRWKPLVFSLGVLVLVCSPTIATWWIVAPGVLLIYNIPLFITRFWGIRAGYLRGERVLDTLNLPAVAALPRKLGFIGSLIAGALCGLSLFRADDNPLHGVQFLIAFFATCIGIRKNVPVVWVLLAAVGLALLLPYFGSEIIQRR